MHILTLSPKDYVCLFALNPSSGELHSIIFFFYLDRILKKSGLSNDTPTMYLGSAVLVILQDNYLLLPSSTNEIFLTILLMTAEVLIRMCPWLLKYSHKCNWTASIPMRVMVGEWLCKPASPLVQCSNLNCGKDFLLNSFNCKNCQSCEHSVFNKTVYTVVMREDRFL